MSISYSGLRTYGKATLPSIESWGQNNTILRDPPKGIQTRKIDKALETSAITTMIEESGDRFSEAISYYARGTNPMVNVSYDNFSNNAGAQSNGFNRSATNNQAYGPYTIMNAGEFRPPIVPPQDLLPLSRLPRVWTTAFTNPDFPDFSKKMVVPNENDNTVGVKKNNIVLRTNVRPTKIIKYNGDVVKPTNIEQYLQTPIQVEAYSGKRTLDYTETNNSKPYSIINNDNMHTYAQSNFGSNQTRFETTQSNVDTSKFIQTPIHNDVNSNKRINRTSLDDLEGYVDVRTKNKFNLDVDTTRTSYDKNEYIHDDIQLNRTLPIYETHTNNGFNQNYVNPYNNSSMRRQELNRPYGEGFTNIGYGQAVDTISDRNYNLKPTINAGEYNNGGMKPLMNYYAGSDEIPTGSSIEQEKLRRNKLIHEMQMSRVCTPDLIYH